MENHTALFFILCLNLANLISAAFSRNNGEVSLLEVVKGLQQRPTLAAVTSEVQTERRDLSGQSVHERLLLSDMGRLEDELETWKEAEKNLERQMTQQTATVESLKAEEGKAIHDEEVAAMVWWDCKMLMCLMLASGVGFCIYNTSGYSKSPSINAAEPAQPTARKVRAQPEFIEKDAKLEAEDLLMLSTDTSEGQDLEAAPSSRQDKWQLDMGCWQLDISPKEQTTVEMPECDDGDRSCCQYFNLNKTSEDPVVLPNLNLNVATPCEHHLMTGRSPRSPEDWWAESQSAY